MTLYNQILSLPLFQGMSRDDLNEIVAHTKFGFSKAQAGDIVVRENDPCHTLEFLLHGTVVVNSHANDNSFSVDEFVAAPLIFEPERLFGLTQYYSHTVVAASDCSLLQIGKEEIMRLSNQHMIFRINLLNRLATDVQKSEKTIWRTRPATTGERIINFFITHSSYPAGHKIFNITMQKIADATGDSRLNVSKFLNKWNRLGIITISRSRIEIMKMENLLQLKDNI